MTDSSSGVPKKPGHFGRLGRSLLRGLLWPLGWLLDEVSLWPKLFWGLIQMFWPWILGLLVLQGLASLLRVACHK